MAGYATSECPGKSLMRDIMKPRGFSFRNGPSSCSATYIVMSSYAALLPRNGQLDKARGRWPSSSSVVCCVNRRSVTNAAN